MASELPASPRFFVLQDEPLWSRYDVEADAIKPINLDEGTSCPTCGGGIGARLWLPPYRANLVLYGEELGDFVKLVGHDLLVSERFAQAFQEEGLTGLRGFHPLEVPRVRRRKRGPKPSHIPQYLVAWTGYGPAAMDLEHSHIRWWDESPTCEWCRSAIKKGVFGFRVEPGTWQGEDICRPRGLFGHLLVSERFQRFVARNGFTNMRLTPTEEYEWDTLAPKRASTP